MPNTQPVDRIFEIRDWFHLLNADLNRDIARLRTRDTPVQRIIGNWLDKVFARREMNKYRIQFRRMEFVIAWKRATFAASLGAVYTLAGFYTRIHVYILTSRLKPIDDRCHHLVDASPIASPIRPRAFAAEVEENWLAEWSSLFPLWKNEDEKEEEEEQEEEQKQKKGREKNGNKKKEKKRHQPVGGREDHRVKRERKAGEEWRRKSKSAGGQEGGGRGGRAGAGAKEARAEGGRGGWEGGTRMRAGKGVGGCQTTI